MSRRLSVVMPVRNAGPYLDAAIHSIVTQSHADFELVIGDDASTDGSREKAREWARRDSRIRLLEGDECLGPAGSANRVATAALHPIVARMDADDISRPDRFERQLRALDQNPDAVLIGSLHDCIDAKGRRIREPDLSGLLSSGPRTPFAHGSIMYRRDAFRSAGGYRAHCDYFEDIDLYLRMARQGRVLIIPEPLFTYRFSAASGRLNGNEQRVEQAIDYYFRCIGDSTQGDDPFPAARRDAPGLATPRAIVSLATLQLWSGHRPRIVARLCRRSALGWNRATMVALAWGIWAGLSPASLRLCLRGAARWRDAAAGRKVDPAALYEWQPVRQSPHSAMRPHDAGGRGSCRAPPAPI